MARVGSLIAPIQLFTRALGNGASGLAIRKKILKKQIASGFFAHHSQPQNQP
jgi:hypothetical protein